MTSLSPSEFCGADEMEVLGRLPRTGFHGRAQDPATAFPGVLDMAAEEGLPAFTSIATEVVWSGTSANVFLLVHNACGGGSPR